MRGNNLTVHAGAETSRHHATLAHKQFMQVCDEMEVIVLELRAAVARGTQRRKKLHRRRSPVMAHGNP